METFLKMRKLKKGFAKIGNKEYVIWRQRKKKIYEK